MMKEILDWGIEVVLWLQQFSPALDLPFKFFTFFGDEEFYLLLLPLTYWCIDRSTGIKLTFLLLISVYINSMAKVWIDQPRPFEYDSRIIAMTDASGGGFPSGHTQSSVVLWGYLSLLIRRRWFWLVSFVMIAMTPLSRVYLGVHFPTDLIGGYLLGVIIFFAFLAVEGPVKKWLAGAGFPKKLLLATIIPLLLVGSAGTDPNGLSAAAVLFGMSIGFVFEQRWVGFTTRRAESKINWGIMISRFLTGMLLVIFVWLGLKLVFEDLEPAAAFRFIRYSLLGFTASYIAPLVFVKLKLAPKKSQ